MISMYCSAHHGGTPDTCGQCGEIAEYAASRVRSCRYGSGKPTCLNCPVHCFGKDMREKTRIVMRWAGPRMMLRHPLLAVLHLLDGRRKVSKKSSGMLKDKVD